jgi:hypothetical protein
LSAPSKKSIKPTEKHVHEVADPVEPEDAEQPHDEQSERNLQQHLASGTQPDPKDHRAAAE